jgi:hypothetical protein
MAQIYNDSKTFVDKPLKYPAAQVLYNFKVFMQVRKMSDSLTSIN